MDREGNMESLETMFISPYPLIYKLRFFTVIHGLYFIVSLIICAYAGLHYNTEIHKEK